MRFLAIGNAYPPHHLGGYEIVCRGVGAELDRRGHRVRVLTTTYRRPGVAVGVEVDPDVHRELAWYWSEHAWLRMTPVGRWRIERHNAAVLDRHLIELRPHAVGWWAVGGMSLSLIERVRRAGIPAVLFVHDPWPLYGPQRDLWTRMWRRARPAAGLAERLTRIPTRPRPDLAGRWLYNSDALRAQVAAALGREVPDWGVLSPGVEDRYLGEVPEPAERSWRWDLAYIGRVVPQKGIHTAIEALAELPGATLRIVGDGDPRYRAKLEALAGHHGVAGRVRFDPPLDGDALIGAYRAAGALVFPVVWDEPWGLVPLEAMALGIPVVATGRGGSGEFLRDGENCLLFEGGDPAGLAEAVRRLSRDAPLRARLVREGRRAAEAHSQHAFDVAGADALTAAGGAADPRERER